MVTEQEREIEQALRELEKRCQEIQQLGVATPTKLARMIDELNAAMAELATREGAERCH